MGDKDLVRQLNLQLANLCKSGKIHQAAFLDSNGKIITISQGFKLNSDEAVCIASSINAPYNGLIRLHVGMESFVCQRSGPSSMIGRTDCDFVCIYKRKGIVVVALSDTESRGSGIFEIEKCCQNLEKLSAPSKVPSLIDA